MSAASNSRPGGSLPFPAGCLAAGSEWRLPLFLTTPDRAQLTRFFLACLQVTVSRAQTTYAELSQAEAEALLGPQEGPLHLGIRRLFGVAGALETAARLDSQHQQVQAYLQDAVDELALRTLTEFRALRLAVDRRVEGMPDRLQKARSLAEEALARYLQDQGSDRDDWLRQASTRIDEVLEQPVGQRDPYAWTLSALIAFQADPRGDTHNSRLLQAYLASTQTRDVLHSEATRRLAWAQSNRQAHEAAFQTLIKTSGADTHPDLLGDLFRYACLTDRREESARFFRAAMDSNPLSILMPFVERPLLKAAPAWGPEMRHAASRAIHKFREGLQHYRRVHYRVAETVEEAGAPSDALHVSEVALHRLEQELEQADLFSAHFGATEARQGAQASIQAGGQELRRQREQCRAEGQHATLQMEKLKAWREENLARVRARHHAELESHRQRLGVGAYDDRASQGCILSFGLSMCFGAAYFVACFVSPSLSLSIGPGSRLGPVLLAVGATPVALGIVFALMDSMRRSLAGAELSRERQRLEQEMEAYVDSLDGEYKAKMPELQDTVQRARERGDEIEACIRKINLLQNSNESLESAA